MSHEIPAAVTLLIAGIVVPASFDARRILMLNSISRNTLSGAGITVVTSVHQLTSEVIRSMFMTKLKWTTVSAVMIVGAISGVSYVMAQGVDHGLSGQNLVLLAKADGIRLTALRPDGAVKQDTQLHKTSKGVMENMPQAIEVMKTAHGIAIRVAQPSQAGHTGMHKTHPVGGQKTK